MAEITAQIVNDLRKRTGLGLMECKTLLKEAEGDMKRAETLAKERGMSKGTGRSGRATKAGRVEVALAADGGAGAMVELNCETDFVARNDAFRQAARELAEHVLAHGDSNLLELPHPKDSSKTVKDALLELNVRTGENVTASRAVRFQVQGSGRVDAYVHHNGTIGALVEVSGGTADAGLVKELAMQAVAARPIAVRREEIPAETVAEQKRIFMTQAADKPEAIRDKIATGKLDAWFGEITLLDQPFVKDSAKKVRDIVKEAGAGLTVSRFALYQVGDAADA